MKQGVVLALVVGAAGAAGCTRPAVAPDVIRQQILALEAERHEAQMHGDWRTIQRLNAPDFVDVAATGAMRSGADNVDAMRAGTVRFGAVDYSDEQVTVHGTTAIVTGIAHRSGTANGAAFDQRLRYSHVYVRRDGRWLLVFGQNTAISPAP